MPRHESKLPGWALTKTSIGSPPEDFVFARTGEGDLGRWAVVRDSTASRGLAIEHRSTDQHEDRFPLAIYEPLSTENVEISVRLKILSGPMLTAGVALSLRNAASYYAVGLNALEQRVDLFLVPNGRIERIESALDFLIERNRWHTVKAVLNDDHFSVSLDGRQLFVAFDRSRGKDGRVALWTIEDTEARFDSIEIRKLPDTEWQ